MKQREKNMLDRRLFHWLAGWAALFLLLLIASLLPIPHRALVCALIGLLALALGIAAAVRVYRPYAETTRRIALLAKDLSLIEEQPFPYHYNRATRQLGQRLSRVFSENTSYELSKRQAQYQALQSQINPHFLYNTLESIRSEALVFGLDNVAEMCEALANFFRYTISKQESLVTMEEELQNIRTYFTIQQFRFANRLKLVIDNSGADAEQLMKCRIPKLTLQPIVENAIIHGVEQKLGQGIVTIRLLLTEQLLLIKISDNGVGIGTEELERLNRQIAASRSSGSGKGGIALSNVNNRIQLLFGESYGLTIYSTPNIGTDVEITLPRSA